MANLVFTKHSDKKIIPLRALVWYGTEGWTTITLLGKESKLNFSPVKRPHYKGGEVTIGYNFEASLIVDYNDYNNNGLLERLEILRKATNRDTVSTDEKNRRDVQLIFGDGAIPPLYSEALSPPMPFATGSLWLDLERTATVSWEMEYVEKRPRVVITLKAFSNKRISFGTVYI